MHNLLDILKYRSHKNELLSRYQRVLVFLIFVGVFTLSYLIGISSKMSDEESKIFLDEFQKIGQGRDVMEIFEYSTSVALPMFIPGVGLVWGCVVAWSTGIGFEALVTILSSYAKIPPLAILYFTPFGVMTLIAYSVGMSRSFLLILTVIRKKPLKRELRNTAAEIGIVLSLLITASLVEYSMIQQTGNNFLVRLAKSLI